MTVSPLISICIPAYKNIEYLQRLLTSISVQTFKDFEVIITDDSNDDTVSRFIKSGSFDFPVVYKKNAVALGSPENWNEAIRNSKGEWIKMMHDDDWFTSANSLKEFADVALGNQHTRFIFSGYLEIDLDTNAKRTYTISGLYEKLLSKSPLYLLKENFIGHPSTTLIKRDEKIIYDRSFKWVVDIDYYIRYLAAHPHFAAIKEPLITIGVNQHQVTKQAFRNPKIEIPENMDFLSKLPKGSLRNIYAYDYFWRLLRNLSIRSVSDVENLIPGVTVPFIITNMIKEQSHWPSKWLKVGIVSKSLMMFSYLKNYSRL